MSSDAAWLRWLTRSLLHSGSNGYSNGGSYGGGGYGSYGGGGGDRMSNLGANLQKQNWGEYSSKGRSKRDD